MSPAAHAVVDLVSQSVRPTPPSISRPDWPGHEHGRCGRRMAAKLKTARIGPTNTRMSVEAASASAPPAMTRAKARQGSLARRLVHNEFACVAVAFVASVLVAYLVLQAWSTASFDRLERQNVTSQAARISSALGGCASADSRVRALQLAVG